jgi:acylphosphatase
MEKIRRHFIFYGYVQGVGFRWRASHTAQRFGITGWVRNLDDGSVEMEAEGTENDINDLIDVLKGHIWGSIDDMISEHIPLQGDHVFEIV